MFKNSTFHEYWDYIYFKSCHLHLTNVKLDIVKFENYYYMCHFYIPCYVTFACATAKFTFDLV